MDSEKDINEEYDLLKEKFNLPDFNKLTEDFDIEKGIEKETRFLIREIRRTIHEKLSAYLNLIEMLINPVSPPTFIFSLLKNISTEDKEVMKKVYSRLSKLQIKVIGLDTVYSEKEEADFVNESFNEWQEIKEIIKKIIEKFELGIEENKNHYKNGYFG
tara:strand:+ start:671 stop:1147 length:477 start_codon:yes stop_codon:yes gene_type:complete